ncbi:hypothetical protein A2701_02560 [Candidatus Amesbacteria bacterium RIFCSPHIGHO2_01_FULL_47_34]|nr:MAG: hypothetical protein A2701_02560 [Candidatus Amesbacteria bacterium RIFCSPHIGHO2_01_FULL_47_34]
MGFLLKILLVAGLVAGLSGLVFIRRGSIPNLSALPEVFSWVRSSVDTRSVSDLKNMDVPTLGKRVSQVLDSLVTHPDRNSPVVLGVKVTNYSLNSLVEVIQKLPPDQVDQLKNVVCSPASGTSSGN